MQKNVYEGYDLWKVWNANSFGGYSRFEDSYFRSELSLIGFTKLEGLNVLEVGYGNGGFASWAIDNNINWLGVEKISDLVSLAKRNGWKAYDSSTDLKNICEPSSIDLVVAFDVFEHLTSQEILDLLKDLRSVMNADGLILGRVPSGDSPFARPFQYGDLTHQICLGSLAIKQLAIQSHYEVIQIREPAYPIFGGGGFSVLRRLINKFFRFVTYQYFKKLIMTDGDWVLSANMIFALRMAK